MQILSTSTQLAAVGNIGTAVATSTDSIWVLVVVAIAIPLAFYILHRVIGLFPKAGGRRS